jgi:mandelate racemase
MAERMTLQAVEVRAVLVPLGRPVVSRVGLYEQWPLILIDLQTEQGVVGRSYLAPYLQQAVRYIVPALQDLAEARKGKPLAPLDDFAAGRRTLGLVGLEGVSLIAVSGLDMAAWDALAKAAGLPLAVHLGGSLAPVPAYHSGGLWLTSLRKLAKEAAELVAEGGFGALKLRLGRERIEDDLQAIHLVREVLGPAGQIMTDFNQGLALGDALQRCHGLDDQGLAWFEEPIAYDDLAGYARLTRELRTPVMLGENFYGPRSLFNAIQAGAGDYLMPDLMRIGGVTGWLRAAALAHAHGIDMSSHLFPEFSVHLLGVTPTGHWLEYMDWAAPLLQEPLRVQNGVAQIPDRPGAGIAWDEDAVKRYAIGG